jgi:hypothetical protein
VNVEQAESFLVPFCSSVGGHDARRRKPSTHSENSSPPSSVTICRRWSGCEHRHHGSMASTSKSRLARIAAIGSRVGDQRGGAQEAPIWRTGLSVARRGSYGQPRPAPGADRGHNGDERGIRILVAAIVLLPAPVRCASRGWAQVPVKGAVARSSATTMASSNAVFTTREVAADHAVSCGGAARGIGRIAGGRGSTTTLVKDPSFVR